MMNPAQAITGGFSGRRAGAIDLNSITVPKTINFVNNFFVAPASFISAASGLLSFALPNFFDSENEFIETLSKYASKAAVGFTGISGLIHNFTNKNFFATLGYGSDIVTSVIANDKSLYPLRALGSALDQLPALLKDSTCHPLIKRKYNKLNLDQGAFHKKFLNYDGFFDSIDKTLFSAKVVVNDLFSDIRKKYKSGGILESLKSIFYVSNGNKENDAAATSSRNLLI